MALPLQETSVSTNRSIAQILDDLELAGFEKVAQVRGKDEKEIFGKWKGIDFRWSANTKDVIDAMIADLGERTKTQIRRKDNRGIAQMQKIVEKAERVAWRVLAEQVRATTIAIRYRTIEPLHGFAGFMTVNDKGGAIDLAGLLTQKLADGELKPGNILSPLLITREVK